jgi:hypothetical protein
MELRASILTAAALTGAVFGIGALVPLPCGPLVSSSFAQSAPPATATVTTAPAASPFPLRVIASRGDGPALYTSASASAPAVGYLSPNAAIELVEAPANGRALVRIRGGMRVRAYLDASRIAAHIQRRGRLRGTPAYLGGGDIVKIVGFEPDGRVRITATVRVGARELEYTGTYPVAGLGDTIPAAGAETTPPGENFILRATRPLRVFDRAGGLVIETIPAGTIYGRQMSVDTGGFTVLLGVGPYIAGFITEQPNTNDLDLMTFGLVGANPPSHGVPERLRNDVHMELAHLAAGTRVSFEGQTLAILDAPGYARVVERHPETGEIDVFVAVDNALAVRGMIPLSSLGELVP